MKELGNETNEEGEGKDRGRKNKIQKILSLMKEMCRGQKGSEEGKEKVGEADTISLESVRFCRAEEDA